jgi:hypothetical protein
MRPAADPEQKDLLKKPEHTGLLADILRLFDSGTGVIITQVLPRAIRSCGL